MTILPFLKKKTIINQFTDIGISGCKLEVIGDIVRKTSPNPEYNHRLELQELKQIKFFTNGSLRAFAPKVYRSGMWSNLYSFDMQYVNGKLFFDEFEKISKANLDGYIHVLIDYLNSCRNNVWQLMSPRELTKSIDNKLFSLRENSRFRQLIDFAIQYNLASKYPNLECGFCHGDLTFSNILFVGDQLCFLDFLDSYIESYVMDIIKLKQDLQYHWFLNVLPIDETYRARIIQIFDYIWDALYIEYQYIIDTELFDVLDLINLLRIEPYINQNNHNILQKAIEKTKIYDKFNRSFDGTTNYR